MIASVLFASLLAVAHPSLGIAEGTCRPGEHGPSILIDVAGMKDRKGLIRAELYPPNDEDFLADDAVLINAGKTFRRVEQPVPQEGPVRLCIRTPGSGTYTLMVLHDRDSNHKFGVTSDGVGFPNNPKLHRRQPSAAEALIRVGDGPTPTRIILNYWHGLFSFGPIHKGKE